MSGEYPGWASWPPRWAHEFADDPGIVAHAQDAIDGTYEGTDYQRPAVGEVVREVMAEVADDLRTRANEQLVVAASRCEDVDDCDARAMVQLHLAAWLDSVVIVHPQPEQTDEDRAWLAKIAQREGLTSG